MTEPIKNPAFIPFLIGAGAILFTAGASYFTGRREGQGIRQQERDLTRAINEGPGGGLPGGVLEIDQPIFPTPGAPPLGPDGRPLQTFEEIQRDRDRAARVYQLDIYEPNVRGTLLPEIPMLDEYSALEKALGVGVVGLAIWAMIK